MAASDNGARAISPAPTGEEAAAIIAAVERFMRATARRAAPRAAAGRDAWSQTAILEGVERDVQADLQGPWMSA
jgi:hypothetical protein